MAKTLENWLATEVAELQKLPLGDLSNIHFFRDPLRPNFIDHEYFFSPADGTILYQKVVEPNDAVVEVKGINYTIKDIMGDKHFDQPVLVIGIFMSLYDVHINRVPYGGLLSYKKLDSIASTNKPMLAVEKDILNQAINPNNMDYIKNNERMLNTFYVPSLNYKYYVVQIADEDVDVITPFKDQKEFVGQNERFSAIRWGSQTDLILPLSKDFDFELCQKDHMHIEAGLDALVKIL